MELSGSTGCTLAVNTCVLVFLLFLWFWSIYQETPWCDSFCACVCWESDITHGSCFACEIKQSITQPYRSIDAICLVLLVLFVPICIDKYMQMLGLTAYMCVHVQELWNEWLQRSQVLPGELLRVVAVLFVFHRCSNNGSPRAHSPPNSETTERRKFDRATLTAAQLHSQTHPPLFIQAQVNNSKTYCTCGCIKLQQLLVETLDLPERSISVCLWHTLWSGFLYDAAGYEFLWFTREIRAASL